MNDKERQEYQRKAANEREEAKRYETVMWTLLTVGAVYLLFGTKGAGPITETLTQALGKQFASWVVFSLSAAVVILMAQKALRGHTWIADFQSWRWERRAEALARRRNKGES